MTTRCRTYLTHAKTQPCAVCGRPGEDALRYGPADKGEQVDDLWAVPLCARCLARYHDGKLGGRDLARFAPAQIRSLQSFVIARCGSLIEVETTGKGRRK